MRITRYERQVKDVAPELDKLQGQAVSQRAVNAMFANPNTAGWNKLASGLMDVANTAATIDDDIKNTNARDAANKMQQNFMAWQSEEMKKKGKDGMYAGRDYQEWQKGQLQELTKDMDDVTKGRFQGLADMQGARYGAWAEGYGHGEKTTYELSTQQAVLDNNAEMLVRNMGDPALAEQSIEQTRAAARRIAEIKGLSPEVAKQLERESLQKALVPAIMATIRGGNVGMGVGMMQQYKNEIGALGYKELTAAAQNKMKVLRNEAEVKAKEAEEENLISGMNAFLSTEGDYATHESFVMAGYDRINEMYPDDMEKRAKAQRLFDSEVRNRETQRDAKANLEFTSFVRDTENMGTVERYQALQNGNFTAKGKKNIQEFLDGERTKSTIQNEAATRGAYTYIDNAVDNEEPLNETTLRAYAESNRLTPKQTEDIIKYWREGGVEGKFRYSQVKTAWIENGGDPDDIPKELYNFVRKQLPAGAKAEDDQARKIVGLWEMEGDSPRDAKQAKEWVDNYVLMNSSYGGFENIQAQDAIMQEKKRTWLPYLHVDDNDELFTAYGVDEDRVAKIRQRLVKSGYENTDFNVRLYIKTNILGLPDDRKPTRINPTSGARQ